MMAGRIILWFRRDLRLRDNPIINAAIERIKSRQSREVVPVYCFDPRSFDCGILDYARGWIGQPKMGVNRARFILESVRDLKKNLRKINSDLHISIGKPEDIIPKYISGNETFIFAEKETTYEEVKVESWLEKKILDKAKLELYWGSTLYHRDDLELEIFSENIKFDTENSYKTLLEHSNASIRSELPEPLYNDLPLPQEAKEDILVNTKEITLNDLPFHHLIREELETENNNMALNNNKLFTGGESSGLQRLKDYISNNSTVACEHNIDDDDDSVVTGKSYLSPWISAGCISPRTLLSLSNEKQDIYDTLYKCLLKRDWCKYIASFYGFRIFVRGGIAGLPNHKKLLRYKYKFDEENFQRWREGRTGIPIIDASMRELNLTGYSHVRCRMVSASYFTNDMRHDWRLGADYFESKSIDYDPAINWVSWMKIANLIKRISTFDVNLLIFQFSKAFNPTGDYIKKWVPELKNLPCPYIHEPWILGWNDLKKYDIQYGISYPTPITDKYFK